MHFYNEFAPYLVYGKEKWRKWYERKVRPKKENVNLHFWIPSKSVLSNCGRKTYILLFSEESWLGYWSLKYK